MRGILNRLIPYISKHGGTAYKGTVIAEDDTGTLKEWSIQIYAEMKNYDSNGWRLLVETKLNNPHSSVDIDNLAVFNRNLRQLDCDRRVHIGELYPIISQEAIDRANGVGSSNTFTDLFDPYDQ